ncbi:hypothetical protein ACOMHN_058042 [Nucella lapillus]
MIVPEFVTDSEVRAVRVVQRALRCIRCDQTGMPGITGTAVNAAVETALIVCSRPRKVNAAVETALIVCSRPRKVNRCSGDCADCRQWSTETGAGQGSDNWFTGSHS